MKRYIIAVKREHRSKAMANWFEPLRDIKDLQIRGTSNTFRIQVDATDEAIEAARHMLGDLCHIEPAIPHRFV